MEPVLMACAARRFEVRACGHNIWVDCDGPGLHCPRASPPPPKCYMYKNKGSKAHLDEKVESEQEREDRHALVIKRASDGA